MYGGWEIRLQYGMRQFNSGFRIRLQMLEYFVGKPTAHLLGHEVDFAGITAAVDSHIPRVFQLPYVIVLKPPEWIFRIVAFSTGTKIHEELLEFFIDFKVGDEPLLISLTTGQGIQQEQGFVGGALGTLLPNGDVLNEGLEMVFVHIW